MQVAEPRVLSLKLILIILFFNSYIKDKVKSSWVV